MMQAWLTGVHAFCDGGGVDQVAMTDGARYVGF